MRIWVPPYGVFKSRSCPWQLRTRQCTTRLTWAESHKFVPQSTYDSSVVWLSWSWSCVLYVLVPDWSSRFVVAILLLVLGCFFESFPGSLSRCLFVESCFRLSPPVPSPFIIDKGILVLKLTEPGPGGEGNTISTSYLPHFYFMTCSIHQSS